MQQAAMWSVSCYVLQEKLLLWHPSEPWEMNCQLSRPNFFMAANASCHFTKCYCMLPLLNTLLACMFQSPEEIMKALTQFVHLVGLVLCSQVFLLASKQMKRMKGKRGCVASYLILFFHVSLHPCVASYINLFSPVSLSQCGQLPLKAIAKFRHKITEMLNASLFSVRESGDVFLLESTLIVIFQ